MLNCFSCVQLRVTLWTVAFQVPLSMRFSRQEHWSGLPGLPTGDLPIHGLNSHLPHLQTGSLPLAPPGKTLYVTVTCKKL